MTQLSENKRLTRNTILLYVRMVFTMIVGLYSSRVILQVLGESDYGLYNVVGGMVYMFAFINTALSGGSQRFITVALGAGDLQKCKDTFSVSFSLHLLVAVFFFIIIEAGGGYLIKNVINIPEGREAAAQWVFHFSLLAICIDLIRLLLDAVVIAHEKMTFYAYLSIFESVIKLSIIYVLTFLTSIDALKLYSVLYFVSSVIVLVIYIIYVKKHFPEYVFCLCYDRKLFKEMGIYTGWNVTGHIAYALSTQGINVILNIFFGTIINAARGLSVQVSGVVNKFSFNFQTATMPQIIKLYASGEIEKMYTLTKNVSKFSGYLYFFISVPLFIEMNYVLHLWLTMVPPYTVLLTRIMILQGGISASGIAVTRVITATGKMKSFCIMSIITQVMSVGSTFLLLYLQVDVEIVIVTWLLPGIICYAYNLYLFHEYTNADIGQFFNEVLFKNVLVLFCSCAPALLLYYCMDFGLLRLLAIFLISTIFSVLSIYAFGIDCSTQMRVRRMIGRILLRLES